MIALGIPPDIFLKLYSKNSSGNESSEEFQDESFGSPRTFLDIQSESLVKFLGSFLEDYLLILGVIPVANSLKVSGRIAGGNS